MYYNKYEKGKCQQKKQCGNSYDVAYYEVKKHDNHNKCKCDIDKTERLIDCIENQAENVLENLQNATPQLANALDALDNVDLSGLVEQLTGVIRTLQNIVNGLTDPTNDIDTAQAAIEAAQNYVNDAQNGQENLIDKIECLENQFEKTVCCLKKDESGHPILIPIEKEYDCGYNKHKKCDCDWED